MEDNVNAIGPLKQESLALMGETSGSCEDTPLLQHQGTVLENTPANLVSTLCPRHWPPPASGDG